jgi:hypothetical protein
MPLEFGWSQLFQAALYGYQPSARVWRSRSLQFAALRLYIHLLGARLTCIKDSSIRGPLFLMRGGALGSDLEAPSRGNPVANRESVLSVKCSMLYFEAKFGINGSLTTVVFFCLRLTSFRISVAAPWRQ